jgi:hypothetical protein
MEEVVEERLRPTYTRDIVVAMTRAVTRSMVNVMSRSSATTRLTVPIAATVVEGID